MAKKEKQHIATAVTPGINIKWPLLWLTIAVVILYLPTLSMGVTDLDDGLFMNTYSDFNEHLGNLFVSFQRTLFNTQADLMYRPVISDVMILNYHLANHGANIVVYHLVNLLLHLISVLLVFKLFIRLGIKELQAFILAMIFAVHPVLTEAATWISARIETALCIFVLGFFIKSIDYASNGKIKDLLLSLLFLLLALFDKETAVVAAPAVVVLLVLVLQKNWRSKTMLVQYGTWVGCYMLWFVARSFVLKGHTPMLADHMIGNSFYRMLTMVQYIGKIFLPFNLSVFPLQEDTVYYYGIVATILLVVILWLNKKRDLKIIAAGAAVFILFLAPTFIIPKNINVQIFEYRIYIPIIGILLMLSQSVLFQSKYSDKQLLTGGIIACCVLAGINFMYQRDFSDPLSFWTQAEASSPHSAYAKMMLSARIGDPAKSDVLFLEAYRLDPDLPRMNLLYAVHLQNKDSVLASEKYLLAEKAKSGYYECDLYLARVAMEKKDKMGAISYLESYLAHDSKNAAANKNLLLLYLDTDQDNKAEEQAKKMKKEGLTVPQVILQHFNL